MKKVLGCIRKADHDYHFIEANDRIAIGVSGGKDSMLLLYCMHLYQKIAPVKFEIIGVHIEMGFEGMDFKEVDRFCMEKGIKIHHDPSKIYEILKLHALDDGRLPCSLCSKFKKGAVIKVSKELGCNKVAFAHHGDDAIETLFMNAIYGGRIATFSPSMFLTNTEITFIRPFVYAFEKDIKKAVKESGVPVVQSTCPMDGFTKRQEFKEMLQKLYKDYPMAKENFLLMLHNDTKTDLWHPIREKEDQNNF